MLKHVDVVAAGQEQVFAVEGTYVPSGDAVVASGVLAEVFEDGALPFVTNPDGTVDTSVYMAWLGETWAAGMAAFSEQSDEVIPATANSTGARAAA